MNDHREILIDINNFDSDNMVYVKPVLFREVAKNIGIYYRDESKSSPKKQKIIVQTPKMMVPFAVREFVNNNRKSYQFSLSFMNLSNLYNEDEIKSFYQFIKKLDKTNESIVMDNMKRWNLRKMNYRKSLQRLSNDFSHYINVRMPYDDEHGFLFRVDDENAEKSNIDIIVKKCVVSAIIEFTELRFDFDKKEFYMSCNLLQVRKFKPYSPIREFFMSQCFICDEDNIEDTAYAKMVERYQRMIRTSVPSFAQMQMPAFSSGLNSMGPPPPPPPPKRTLAEIAKLPPPPRVEELLKGIKSLRKTGRRDSTEKEVVPETAEPPAIDPENIVVSQGSPVPDEHKGEDHKNTHKKSRKKTRKKSNKKASKNE